ncbi:MAG TPA: FecR family protein [Bacteroidales bacterium]|nr:FecR family protein [Bacteroidales bacterium]
MNKSNPCVEDFILNESFIRYVLDKSEDDLQFWNSWIDKHPEASDIIQKAEEIIRFVSTRKILPQHNEVSEKVFLNLQQQIKAAQNQREFKQKRILPRYYWYAASLLFFVALALFFRPKFNTDTLIADNRFLEVIVPVGQRSQLILPDGTKVWLNAGTNFKYPANFLKNSREVHLSGEAFFDVSHQRNNLPFIVHLKENLSVRVLGTEFNVKSYDTDKIIETTLVNGSIRLVKENTLNQVIQELSLKPNEKALYEKESKQIVISSLLRKDEKEGSQINENTSIGKDKLINEIELVTAWKNEELVFHDETFEEIAVRMERWYGLKITVNDESLKKERFTGKFVNNESIYQILDIFNRSESIQYTTKQKELIISKRRK